MSKTIKDVFDLKPANQLTSMGFVVRLREADRESSEFKDLVNDYVITPSIEKELPLILDKMKQVYARGEEYGRFIHGSFGSGKSHFMAILSLLLDANEAVWRIPAERMKMRRPHDVPLSKQALKIIKDIWSLSENGELVLPSIRSLSRPLSENAMNSALRRMGYAQDEMTAHGFRSTASTILNERGFNPDVIEAALAHVDDDEIRRAYNRAKYLTERTKLMQDWADLLDEFRKQSVRPRRAA